MLFIYVYLKIVLRKVLEKLSIVPGSTIYLQDAVSLIKNNTFEGVSRQFDIKYIKLWLILIKKKF